MCQKCAKTVNQVVGSAVSCFPPQPEGDRLYCHGAPKSGKLPLMEEIFTDTNMDLCWGAGLLAQPPQPRLGGLAGGGPESQVPSKPWCSIAAAGTVPPRRHPGEFSTRLDLALPAGTAALTVHSEKSRKVGAHTEALQEGCSWPRGVWGGGGGQTGWPGLRSRFCLFSLCPSSTSLFPEPGMLGCAEALWVEPRPPLGLGGEDQGTSYRERGQKPMSRLPPWVPPFLGRSERCPAWVSAPFLLPSLSLLLPSPEPPPPQP